MNLSILPSFNDEAQCNPATWHELTHAHAAPCADAFGWVLVRAGCVSVATKCSASMTAPVGAITLSSLDARSLLRDERNELVASVQFLCGGDAPVADCVEFSVPPYDLPASMFEGAHASPIDPSQPRPRGAELLEQVRRHLLGRCVCDGIVVPVKTRARCVRLTCAPSPHGSQARRIAETTQLKFTPSPVSMSVCVAPLSAQIDELRLLLRSDIASGPASPFAGHVLISGAPGTGKVGSTRLCSDIRCLSRGPCSARVRGCTTCPPRMPLMVRQR